ncbi:MAG: GNAT family N-acetyltransferase [Rhizomicrobium sp.]
MQGRGADGLVFLPAIPRFLKEILQNRASDAALRGIAKATMAHAARVGARPPWTGYFAREGEVLVGVGSFAAPPSGGEVEIAYHTFTAHECRGIASAMAGHLIAVAFAQPVISAVVANTAPEPSASTRILEKQGFVRDGVAADDEIGEAWRWKKSRPL